MKVLLLILCFATLGFAQDIEYGSEADLKGLTRIYITTRGDIKSRNEFIREIEKAKVGLKVVETYREAEIFVKFGGGSVREVFGARSTTTVIGDTPITTTAVNSGIRRTGWGEVMVDGKNSPDAIRVVMNFESTQDKVGEKKPAIKFAREFLKLYKKANED